MEKIDTSPSSEILVLECPQKPFQPRACDYTIATHTKVEKDRKKALKKGYRKHKTPEYGD